MSTFATPGSAPSAFSTAATQPTGHVMSGTLKLTVLTAAVASAELDAVSLVDVSCVAEQPIANRHTSRDTLR